MPTIEFFAIVRNLTQSEKEIHIFSVDLNNKWPDVNLSFTVSFFFLTHRELTVKVKRKFQNVYTSTTSIIEVKFRSLLNF